MSWKELLNKQFNYLILIQLFFVLFIKASLQARRLTSSPTKLCDKPCFNGGICRDGVCLCPSGWTGSQCDSCFGRIK